MWHRVLGLTGIRAMQDGSTCQRGTQYRVLFIYGLGSGLVSQVLSLGDALGVVGKKVPLNQANLAIFFSSLLTSLMISSMTLVSPLATDWTSSFSSSCFNFSGSLATASTGSTFEAPASVESDPPGLK